MKKILVLTPTYPAYDFPKELTPVVHYFTREWVKNGYEVVVVNYPVNFPKWITRIASLIEPTLTAFFGFSIRAVNAKPLEYTIDDVRVKRIPMKKLIPHSRYSSKEKRIAVAKTIAYCKEIGFTPDVIISHWANPGMDLMPELKKEFGAKSCFVEHSPGTDILNMFSKEQAIEAINNVDIIGFRSDYIKRRFCELHGYNGKYFMCYSGIPEAFVGQESTERTFDKVNSFIYVGHLIKRKYPSLIIPAVYNAVNDRDFTISYLGRGGEEKSISKTVEKYNVSEKVNLYGRQERSRVVELLKQHDVFIMISKNETFGLVYLEAMAVGCITIASRQEGFDGIIKHGYNGFLCEAGNQEELERLIKEIRSMSPEDLQEISRNAIATAKDLTDKKVARTYIEAVLNS